MKNLYLLDTDKPSRLQLQMDGNFHIENGQSIALRNYQHICITSDEEIKDGDWLLIIDDFETYIHKHKGDNLPTTYYKKIILTTDQDLINNGIEQISEYTLLKIVEHINSGKNIESFDEL